MGLIDDFQKSVTKIVKRRAEEDKVSVSEARDRFIKELIVRSEIKKK